ncbi:peptidoglycan DD-metalloendopeptidase family protein [Ferrovum sp. PN-J185]|uniref:murein hydrolase activator EnvC family protein n=1 Tax=Ferrovum sp. PN-J185 TaxID=1356306 RepID=UPI001E4D929C|nr:peptidoglycan DD-metalloendopeptidase family protein [Ferrovum sp. PN-J185]MCC6068410.1 peptidoglycan DD-metalloendopeptidase family protein [Ferrovum sp. PN-J185]MDE1891516.1 peptidoglycan DD-metalloendopeptidase family protein [Betaproteobacteria bacterium]MDE2055850.1 peptidoglycan DD-metalloendopeptidase family protein [Betaproteobacteria bacterium]
MKQFVCFFWGVLWLSTIAMASPRHDLNHVQKQIHQLKKDLNETKHNRALVQSQVRQLEKSIQSTAKKRYQLQLRENSLRQTIVKLEKETEQAGREQNVHESNLFTLIHQRYEQSLLPQSGSDQQTKTQFWLQLEYLSHLARDQDVAAKLALLKANQLQQLANKQRDKVNELKQVELTFQQQSIVLEEQKKKRDALYAELSKTEQGQQQRLNNLIKNEQALTKLVKLLEKKAKSRKLRPTNKKPKVSATPHATQEEQRIGNNTVLPNPEESSTQFTQLKGHLHLPLLGELANRFGSPRSDTGLTWHGIYIKSEEGLPVKAVAAGQVVYADWLRGFGNLIIIDHGAGYMSLYGGAQALLAGVGHDVKMGDTIATSGRSGSNPQTGIYFELRYQSKPFDPLGWVGGR